MADHSQHQQEASATSDSTRGGRQAVVELQRITRTGIILWSRQRFEIGSEVQIRVGVDALPEALKQSLPKSIGPWAVVTGYVVESPAVRKDDGTLGFQVSVLLDAPKGPQKSATSIPGKIPVPHACGRLRGHARYGLN
jgi:hypothetical protein